MTMNFTVGIVALALLTVACAQTATTDEPRACCLAMTAECLACADGVSVQEYCATNPQTVGCAPEDGLCGTCCSDAGATDPRCETVRCACEPQDVPNCAAIQCPVGNDCIDGVGCVPAGEPTKKAPGTACTMEYNPVCGENGITYGNPCMANAEGMTYTMGECA